MATLKIPTPNMNCSVEQKIQALYDAFSYMRKELEQFSNFVDSDNVTEINTNITTFKSDHGTMTIDGPLMTMNDLQPIIRLQAGYNKNTGQFTFTLLDTDGNQTLTMTDLGQILLTGKPLIQMYDSSNVLRLQMGYDPDMGKFVFELCDLSGKKNVYLDEDGTEVLDGKFLLTHLGITLLEAFKDTHGGKIAIYDNDGQLNVHIGVEGSGGGNVGGTMRLYNDSPDKPRVAMGVSAANDSGAIEALDSNNKIRTYMSGGQADGEAGFFVYNALGSIKSYLRESDGKINNKNIATEDFVTEKGYITGTTGFTGTKTVGIETWTFIDGVLQP